MFAKVILLVALLGADTKEDLEKLHGTWQRTSIIRDGKEASAEDVKKESLTIKGDGYVLTIGDQMRKGTFKLDAAKTPKTIDIMSADGPNKGKVLQGIYELNGDELKYCLAPPGKDRPTEFSSKPGSGHLLFVSKKVK